jgi:hypothetical protein
MSDAVGLKGSTTTLKPPASKPLDEAVWQAWKAKGRAQDRQGRETRVQALTRGSIIALLAVAGLWSQVTSYDIVIRCLLVAGAVGLLLDAIEKQHYAIAAVFAGIAILYNPIAPLFGFSGTWQRALVVLSAVPFAASLAQRGMKEAHVV